MSLASLGQPSSGRPPVADRRTIPFDHRFVFSLDGNVGSARRQRITVSIEAAFVAVSIGYAGVPRNWRISFGPRRLEDLETLRPVVAAALAAAPPPPPPMGGNAGDIEGILALRRDGDVAEQRLFAGAGPAARAAIFAGITPADRRRIEATAARVPPRRLLLGDVFNSLSRALGEEAFAGRGEIGPLTAQALEGGIRIRPEAARLAFLDGASAAVPMATLATLFETVQPPPQRLEFLYALFDEATGRAFQNEPLLNTAGLGTADGDRPFRSFVPPIRFAPRSVIGLEITPVSDFVGELHIVLHGYKVLGGAGTPTGRALRRRRPA